MPETGQGLDERIAEALAIERFHSNQLVCILAYVDSREKLILQRAELTGGLARLIHAGRVREAAHLEFELGSDSSKRFSGVEEPELERAIGEYRDWVRRGASRFASI